MTKRRAIAHFLRRLLTVCLGAGSSIGLAYRYGDAMAWWHFLVLAILVVLAVFAIRQDYIECFADLPRLCVRYNDQEAINSYMYTMLSEGGRVAIFSRDLTWVRESELITALLKQKAANDEVTIFMPKENQIAGAIKAAGAKIVTYQPLHYDPTTRFTIRFHSSSGSRVAIGSRHGEYHVVREYDKDELPFELAEDITNIIEKVHELITEG